MAIFKRQALKTNERKFFTNVRDAMPVPDLIDVQKSSYDWFLKFGIKDLFEEVSPMTDFTGRDLELYLENYYLDEPKFDEVVCNIKTKIKKTEDEFDIVMYNGASIALIEIKHKVHPNDLITLYTTKIENFRLLYPAYKNHNIYLGIGGFSVPSSVEQQAHSRGIAVLKQKADVAVIDVKKLKIY